MVELSKWNAGALRRWAGLCLLACLCGLAPGWVHAGNAVVATAFYEDRDASLDFAQARQQTYTPYTGLLQRGYVKSAHWIRVSVQGSAAPSRRSAVQALSGLYVLRIQPGYIDEITLYDPEHLDAVRKAGDRQPVLGQDYRSLNHNFVIPMGQDTRDVWLRLKTESASLLDVEAMPLDEAINRDQLQMVVLCMFVAAMLVFMIWCTLNWYAHPDAVTASQALNQLIVFSFSVVYLGYLRMILLDRVSPNALDLTTCVFVIGLSGSACLSNYFLLREFKPNKWAMRLLLLMICSFPMNMGLLALGHVQEGLRINQQVNVFGPVLLLVCALSTHVWNEPGAGPAPIFSKRFLVLLYVGLLVLVVPSAALTLGLINSPWLKYPSFPVYGFASSTILVLTLRLRAARLALRHHATEARLRRSEQEVLHEQQERKAQTDFMAMLTHELKTPLAVVRMVLGSPSFSASMHQRADRAIGSMSAVIDRCLADDRERSRGLECVGLDLNVEVAQMVKQTEQDERVHLSMSAAPCLIVNDRQLLHLVVGNLIENALKYAAPSSLIRVELAGSASAGRDGVLVSVANLPGQAGWPDPARVFEKFYRSRGAHHQTGSGLGLYLVAAMSERMGGEARYCPDQENVRFALWLPV